jgi:hypothetical protein
MGRTIVTSAVLLMTLSVAGTAAVVAQDNGSLATPGASAEVMSLPLQRGPLEAGTYGDDSVGAQVMFELPDGWFLVEKPIEGIGFVVSPGDSSETIAVTRFDGDVHAEPCFAPDEPLEGDSLTLAAEMWLLQPENRATVPATVEGFWEHLTTNPHLVIEEPAEVQVGGHTGLQGKVTAAIVGECSPPDVFLWDPPEFPVWLLPDSAQAVYTALDVAGAVIVIAAESTDAHALATLVEQAAPMIETLAITPLGES